MNRFQLTLLTSIIEKLAPVPLGDIRIEITKGPNEPTVEVVWRSHRLSFWIYEDEASILGEGVDARFERADFPDETRLAEVFLRSIDRLLSDFNRSTKGTPTPGVR